MNELHALPLEPRPSSVPDKARPPILIVDDDPDICQALSQALEHEGYQVRTAGAGAEAIERVKSAHYAAVLLDLKLPDLDGLWVLRILTKLDRNLPVIVLTAYGTEENRIGSFSKGAFACVSKPYNLDEIKATVQRAVEVKALAVKAERVEHALTASEERFRSVVESATDAIILADRNGTIISWNQAAERLFGYTEEEVLGQPLSLLMPARYREAHQNEIHRVGSTGECRVIGKTVELHGLRKDGTEFPLEFSLGTWKTKDGMFFSGIIRDITVRKTAERRHAAQYTVTRILAECSTLAEATPKILQAICESLGWDVGAIWTVDEHADVLRCVELWHSPDIAIPAFQTLTKESTFGRGLGLPGRVWAAGEASWIPDVVDDPNFPRASVAAQDRLHAAFAFPIKRNSQVLGVFEFFIREIRQPDEDLLRMLTAIGSQIGQFIERKQAEAALRESQERFRQLAESIREVFWMTDVQKNQMIYISPGYEEIWGRSCESLYAAPRSWLDAIHPDDRPRVLEAAMTKQIAGEYDEEYRIVRLDGVIRWVRDRAFPIRNDLGLVYRIAGVAADITERKQAQEALRNAYNAIDAIMSSLPCSIVIMNDAQQVVFANSWATQHFGSGGVPLIGRALAEVLPLKSGDWNRVLDDLGTVRTGREVQQRDREFELRSRVYRYCLFPVAIHDEARTGLLIWDITEQKELQDQLIQAEKLASLGTMVSGMAHEINNPMHGILGMAELILEENNPDNIKEYARDIVAYSHHVATVVRDFACYARSASHDEEVEVDLNERLVESVKMVRRSPQFGRVEVITSFQPRPRLRARQSEIDQVLVNLISNAVQAMEGRGRLTLTTRVEDGKKIVMISDTGCGIPKALLPKIFEPFFTTKVAGKGTGLGLSIVHKIVTKYGGSISVESDQGKGTTFRVQFPDPKP